METGSSRVLVVPRAGGGWELRETRTGPVMGRSATKDELVARARLGLEAARGGEVVVLVVDGSVQETRLVRSAPPRPWWYLRPGVLRWLLPLIVGLQLALRLVAGSGTPFEVTYTVALAVAFPLLAITAWRSVALDRTRAATDDLA